MNASAQANAPAKGRFITFEGIDGAGKSTHIGAVAERLRQAGAEVVLTREPGGTELAERLRHLVLHTPMDALTEALLVFAARRDHLQRVIEPALARAATVLCDRFTDATFAYQGAGRNFDIGVLHQLETWVHGDLAPDLTFWFDLDPEVARRRLADARTADRFEAEGIAFFGRVRDGYRARQQLHAARFARIDAGGGADDVWQQIVSVLAGRGW